jgi:hypothetical protein
MIACTIPAIFLSKEKPLKAPSAAAKLVHKDL